MHVIDVAEYHDRKKVKHPELEAVWRGVRTLIPKARRFVFDEEASAFAGRFIRDFGPALLENLQFAIPPFENCYIEYHLDTLLDTIRLRKTDELQVEPFVKDGVFFGRVPKKNADVDERIGHLILNNSVVTFVENSKGDASLYPVAVRLHAETYSRGAFSADLEDDKFRKMAYTLGSTCRDLRRVREETLRRWLHTIDIFTGAAFRPLLEKDGLRDGGNGTVRNLVALLLILNRQRDYGTGIKQVAPKGVIYKGKRRVYMAHSLVTLTTEDYGRITRSFAAGGHHESPRRHQVRGFFRHYHKVRGCEHAFIEDDQPLHWTCQHCGTIRVWIRDHERGDASKGYTTKEYAVTDPAADL